jgi:hypothetical protein
MYTDIWGDGVEREAVRTYGVTSQLIVAIEELSELQKELTKQIRGNGDINHISEEMADVYIMLEQLGIIFGNGSLMQNWKYKKLKRLEQRIRNGDAKI